MANHKYDGDARILKHDLSSRLFHWGLILGFLPAAFTGIIIWLKPGSEDFVNMAMKIHILGAGIMTISCVAFFIIRYDLIVVFWRRMFSWSADDIAWMKVGGGYPQQMFFGKTVPVPQMGKLNPGQKMLGIIVFFGMNVITLTGWILYLFLPMVPKQIALYTSEIHLYLGLFLTLAVLFGHIALALYNWEECVCMFGDGTIKVSQAAHHNQLWIDNEIEPVKSPVDSGVTVSK